MACDCGGCGYEGVVSGKRRVNQGISLIRDRLVGVVRIRGDAGVCDSDVAAILAALDIFRGVVSDCNLGRICAISDDSRS